MKNLFFCFWVLGTIATHGQTMIKEGRVDTIRFVGQCRYMGFTGSIIATTYYQFKVDQVLTGIFEGDTIVFESNINSRNLVFRLQPTQSDLVTDIPVLKIFPDCNVPVSKIYRCHNEILEIQVVKVVEDLTWMKRGVRITYQKLYIKE